MSRTHFGIAAIAVLSTFAATPALANGTVQAPPGPRVSVVSSSVVAPFNLEVSGSRALFADGFANVVGSVSKTGTSSVIAADQPGTSGIALSQDRRTTAFTTTVTVPNTVENTDSGLNIWGPNGAKTYVDTLAYEKANNPDQVNHYGVDNPTQCVTDALEGAHIPVSYNGMVDSHAYSVAAYKDGWVIADAGSNVLWRVDGSGNLSTLAVLPPQPLTITAEQAGALGMPDCLIGVTYAFEPVPTDVEVGRDGMLYVTTLPGGPESPALGARGSVYKVNPNDGSSHLVATGFLGATNLALGSAGRIYVAELFAGRISVIRGGQVSTFVELPGVLSVETQGTLVWAGTMAQMDEQGHITGPGTIVRITP